jgi:hypothetical protein
MPRPLWTIASVFEKEVAELEEKGNRRASKKKLEKGRYQLSTRTELCQASCSGI